MNYGLGNIKAIQNVYLKLNIPVKIASTVSELQDTEKIILPGVGAFDYAMDTFNRSGMREELTRLVMEEEIPVIGICVGMQMLAGSSDEGVLPGLGWVDASVKKFDLDPKLQLPHMGWNDVIPVPGSPLFQDMTDPKFYFLHSYYIQCNDSKLGIARSSYPDEFVCAVNHKNVYGVQFHPEKSHGYGLKLLENFARI